MSGGMIILLFLVLITLGLPIAIAMGIPAAIYLIIEGIMLIKKNRRECN